jgi:pimeloyl-ACP methyl ester carboxylesterase
VYVQVAVLTYNARLSIAARSVFLMARHPSYVPGVTDTVDSSALVFLHGATGSGQAHFGHLADRFGDRRKVVLPDIAGSGTSALATDPFTFEQVVDEVVAVVDAHGTPVDLVGFSLGAVVAAALAAKLPQSIRRLVLVAGWARSDARHQLVNRTWARLEQTDPEAFASFGPVLAFSPAFLASMGNDGIAQVLSAGLPAATGRQLELCRDVDISDRLDRITAPTLVVGCTQDGLVPVDHSRALHEAIAGSRYAEIDCGHAVMFERPGELTRVLRSFIVDDTEP